MLGHLFDHLLKFSFVHAIFFSMWRKVKQFLDTHFFSWYPCFSHQGPTVVSVSKRSSWYNFFNKIVSIIASLQKKCGYRGSTMTLPSCGMEEQRDKGINSYLVWQCLGPMKWGWDFLCLDQPWCPLASMRTVMALGTEPYKGLSSLSCRKK